MVGTALLLPREKRSEAVDFYFHIKAVMGHHYSFHTKELVGNGCGDMTVFSFHNKVVGKTLLLSDQKW